MKQLLVKLSDEEFSVLEEYCKKTGRTKSAVIRYHISKLNDKPVGDLRSRKIKRISPGIGKLVSEHILEMRK
ncbi:MAG: hypothetical protein PVH84_08705 [Candidatus Aminicenantes bacterium]|jgi:hypothetical protein